MYFCNPLRGEIGNNIFNSDILVLLTEQNTTSVDPINLFSLSWLCIDYRGFNWLFRLLTLIMMVPITNIHMIVYNYTDTIKWRRWMSCLLNIIILKYYGKSRHFRQVKLYSGIFSHGHSWVVPTSIHISYAGCLLFFIYLFQSFPWNFLTTCFLAVLKNIEIYQ